MNSSIASFDFCLKPASSYSAFLLMSAGWNITERFHLNSSKEYSSRLWESTNMLVNRSADPPFIRDKAIMIFCMLLGVCWYPPKWRASCLHQLRNSFLLPLKYGGFRTKDLPISGAEDRTAGGDLSLGSSGKVVVYFFASWAAKALETALLMSAESSLWERVTWLELEGDLPNILFGEGGKVSVEDMGKGGGESVGVVKCDMTGTMSEY